LLSPFCFFFDRLALADGLLSCLGIWFLIGAVGLMQHGRLDLAMVTGILLGLGLITKSPALFFALLLPLTLLMVNDGTMKQFNNLLKLFGLWLVVLLFGYAIYNILRLGPEFHMIAIRNKDYVFSLAEVLKHPLSPLMANLRNSAGWYWVWLTPPVFLLGGLGILGVLRKNFKTGLFLAFWWVLPLLGQGLIAKVYTARYVLFTVPIFLIFAAAALEKFFQKTKNERVVIGGLVIVFLLPVYQLALLILNPQRAWLPAEERSGYLEQWTAGYGVKEAALYLKETAKTQKVLVGTEGYFGTLPDGLQIYLEGMPNITIIGVGQPISEISSKLTDGLKENRVFLVVNDSRLQIPNNEGLKLLARYPKAINARTGNWENLLFFELLESKDRGGL